MARGGGIANFEGSPQTPEALGLVAEAAAAHGDGEGAELVGDEVALEDGLERTEIPGVGGDPVDVVMGIGAAGIVADDAAGLMSGMIRLGVWGEGPCPTPRSPSDPPDHVPRKELEMLLEGDDRGVNEG